jgi:hypothetical protein
MRSSLVLLFTWCLFRVFAQEYVYIQTGRPHSLERNNAFRTVGKTWGMGFTYQGGDVYDEAVHGSIESYNSSIIKKVQAKHPEVTLETIQAEVNLEVNRQEELESLIQSSLSFKTWKHKEMGSTLLLFDRQRGKKMYLIYRIYPVYKENGQHYELGQVYQCNLKNKRVRLLKVTSTALPFGFPENGIH